MLSSLQIAIAAWVIGLVLASPFGLLFFLSYTKIKKKYDIDIWMNIPNVLKLLTGKSISGIEDEDGLKILKLARIGIIGWNVVLLPAMCVFFYFILEHTKNL